MEISGFIGDLPEIPVPASFPPCTWWLGRLNRGCQALAPGPTDNGLQFINARDPASL